MLAEQERAKYETAWGIDGYRAVAPGEHFTELFMEVAGPEPGESVIDFGTGTGRAALDLQNRGLDVYPVDLASNCLDEESKAGLKRQLLVANLWEPIDLPKAKYGLSTDVMEHIPPEKVESVLKNIRSMTDAAFFTICFHEDHFGQEVGSALHLTIRPFTWWRDLLKKYGKLEEARDLIGEGVFYVRF